jgi:hypothetical protein
VASTGPTTMNDGESGSSYLGMPHHGFLLRLARARCGWCGRLLLALLASVFAGLF